VNDYTKGAPASEALRSSPGRTRSPANGRSPFFAEEVFTTLLTRERKRAERSRQPFALLLLDVSQLMGAHPRDLALGGSSWRSPRPHARRTSGAGTRRLPSSGSF
jgi:hypothetical protein